MKILVLLFSLLFISGNYATSKKFQDQNGQGVISLGEKWDYLKEAFGMPHFFLSKGAAPKSSVSITFTGMKDIELSQKGLAGNQGQYKKGRKKWAKKRMAKILKFSPYKFF